MADTFLKLCNEAINATKFVSLHEQWYPHYRPVLEYILVHPNEHDEMVDILCKYTAEGGNTEIFFLEFLMETLQWPEIKSAAETRLKHDGYLTSHAYSQIEQLVDVYNPSD